MNPRVTEHMRVDASPLGDQLQVNINITFHALSCNDVHLDVMDIAGDNQLNVEHEMLKQRLTKEGRPIGRAGVEIIGEVCRKFVTFWIYIFMSESTVCIGKNGSRRFTKKLLWFMLWSRN